jgi:hypothetical protein
MNIYFDANFPPSIPQALDKLEEFDRENNILSTAEEFGQDIKDPQLIKAIAKKKGVWVTFDRSALKAHIKVLKRYKVPIFAFEYGSHRYWDKTYLTLKHWAKIKNLISENKSSEFYVFRVMKSTVKLREY